jgi:hypothetical protein
MILFFTQKVAHEIEQEVVTPISLELIRQKRLDAIDKRVKRVKRVKNVSMSNKIYDSKHDREIQEIIDCGWD